MVPFFFVLCFISLFLAAMDTPPAAEKSSPKPVIAVHLSIVSDRENPDTAADQSAEVGKRLFKNADRFWVGIKLWTNKKAIDEKGKELAKLETGTTNVTKQVLEKYGVTDGEIRELTKAAINPEIKEHELNFIKDLKAQGFKIVGITDQDHVHHEIYREKVSSKVDLNELLEGIVTIPYIGDRKYADMKYTELEKWCQEHNAKWYVAKPNCHTSACEALRKLVDEIDPQAPIVMIDVKKNSAVNAAESNINRIQYESLEQLKKQLQEMNLLK